MNPNSHIKTLGQLKASGYASRSVKEEMRENLVRALREKKNLFGEIKGYEETVIPQLQTAILSRHNIILLGLRGQAKTKIARLMTNLLDEYMPIVAFSEANDDPLNPLTRYAKDVIDEKVMTLRYPGFTVQNDILKNLLLRMFLFLISLEILIRLKPPL